MRIEILDDAKEDLVDGFRFYNEQLPGLGSYFLDSLFADIDSLLLYAGTHRTIYGSFRSMASRFPFAIYYRLENDVIRVRAVIVAVTILNGFVGVYDDEASKEALPPICAVATFAFFVDQNSLVPSSAVCG